VQSECLIESKEKCTTQSVPNADRNVKFPSNLTEADLYTVENVIPNEDPREEVDIKLTTNIYSRYTIFFYPLFSFHALQHTCRGTNRFAPEQTFKNQSNACKIFRNSQKPRASTEENILSSEYYLLSRL